MVRGGEAAMETHEDPASAFGNKVSRLKTLFQDADKENRGRQVTSTSNTRPFKSYSAERSPDIKRKRPDTLETNQNASNKRSQSAGASAANQKAASNKWGGGGQTGNRPSRVKTGNRSQTGSGNEVSSGSEVEAITPVTDELYETTNHVQRFHRTRAIFAQMERQNKHKKAAAAMDTSPGADAHRRRLGSRSVSPAARQRQAMSPPLSPVRLSATGQQQQRDTRRHSPTGGSPSPKSRTQSDSAYAFDFSHNRVGGGGRRFESSTGSENRHMGSVDNIADDNTAHAYSFQSNEIQRQRYSDMKSRSEGDLLAAEPEEPDVFTSNQPSPRSLIQKFESGRDRGGRSQQQKVLNQHSTTTSGTSQLSHQSRFLPSSGSTAAASRDTSYRMDTSPDASARKPAGVVETSSYVKPTSFSSTTSSVVNNRDSQQQSHAPFTNSSNAATASHVISNNDQSNAATSSTITSSRTSSSTTNSTRGSNYARAPMTRRGSGGNNETDALRKNREYIPKFKADHADDEEAMSRMDSIYSWRSRRQNSKPDMSASLDSGVATQAGLSSGGNVPSSASTGVLLARRRARDDALLTKEEIEASLNQADTYWQSEQSHGATTNTVTSSAAMLHSSGSGEEMARSDSTNDIILDSPTTPTSYVDPTSSQRRSGDVITWTSSTTTSQQQQKHIPSSDYTSSEGFEHTTSRFNGQLDSSMGEVHDGFLHRTDTFESKMADQASVKSDSGSLDNRLDSDFNQISQQGQTNQHISTEEYDRHGGARSSDEEDVSNEIHLHSEHDAQYETPQSPAVVTKPPPPFPEATTPIERMKPEQNCDLPARLRVQKTISKGTMGDKNRMMGILDLGGGSTQITFVPRVAETVQKAEKGYLIKKDVQGEKVDLYTHSYLGLGLMSGRFQTMGGIEDPESNDEVNPDSFASACLAEGFSDTMKYNGKEYKLSGSPAQQSRYTECYAAAKEFLPKYKVQQVAEINQLEFVTISYYYDRAVESGLIDQPYAQCYEPVDDLSEGYCEKDEHLGGVVAVRQFVEAGERACSSPANPEMPYLCLDLSYITALMKEGFGFHEDTQVLLRKKINDIEITWGLGAIIDIFNTYGIPAS